MKRAHTLLAFSGAKSLYFELVKVVTGIVSESGLSLFSNLEFQIYDRLQTSSLDERGKMKLILHIPNNQRCKRICSEVLIGRGFKSYMRLDDSLKSNEGDL